jgi:sulfate permease, SulP family
VFPQPVIRGIQLSVGLLLCQLAWRPVSATPKAFNDHRHSIWWLAGVTLVVIAVALLLRRLQITLVFITIAVAAIVLTFRGSVTFGPSAVHFPHLSRAAVHP